MLGELTDRSGRAWGGRGGGAWVGRRGRAAESVVTQCGCHNGHTNGCAWHESCSTRVTYRVTSVSLVCGTLVKFSFHFLEIISRGPFWG